MKPFFPYLFPHGNYPGVPSQALLAPNLHTQSEKWMIGPPETPVPENESHQVSLLKWILYSPDHLGQQRWTF